MKKYFTKEGLERIKKELEELKTKKRREISKRIEEAASFGDLSENAAYTEAKEEQAFLEGKITEMESKIREAKIIEKGNMEKVEIGSTVIVVSDDGIEEYILVDSAEANPLENKISYSSPLGKIFLNRKVGEKVEFSFDENKKKYLIKEIK